MSCSDGSHHPVVLHHMQQQDCIYSPPFPTPRSMYGVRRDPTLFTPQRAPPMPNKQIRRGCYRPDVVANIAFEHL